MDANWQMMAMLNILVCICGACMMFHTEYADKRRAENGCAAGPGGKICF